MSELNTNIEETTEVTNEVATVEKKESKVKGALSKVGAGVKKHGGKVVGALLVGGLAVAAFALGKKTKCEDSDESGYDEGDVVDVEYSEEETE